MDFYYWRERDDEVDYVIKSPRNLWALDVKSGRSATSRGLSAFLRRYPDAKPLMIGAGAMDLETFFHADPMTILA